MMLLLVASATGRAQFTAPPFQPDSSPLGQADLRDILGLLCPGQEYIGRENGCHVCPVSTRAAGVRTEAGIGWVVRGHFLKTESDDLLVVLYGCAPGGAGDAVLLTHSTSGWYVNPAAGLPGGACRKIPSRSGRDGLVCFEATAGAGREDARLRFGYVGERNTDLLAALDNTGGACDAPKRVVVQSAVQDVKFTPGAEGRMALTISARCRRGPLSARSAKACAQGPGFADIGPVAPFRAFRIEYAFNGEAFSLAPASRAVKQAYDICAAEER